MTALSWILLANNLVLFGAFLLSHRNFNRMHAIARARGEGWDRSLASHKETLDAWEESRRLQRAARALPAITANHWGDA